MKLCSLFILLFITGSCSTVKEDDKFSGNWFTCAKDGLYIELLIRGNSFRYSTSEGLVTEWQDFKISGDTLIYGNRNLIKDSVFVVKAVINKVSNNEMKLDYITSDESWTFTRINEAIADIENIIGLKTGTKVRSDKYKCIDKRTNEEKAKDSLMRNIDFRF